MRKKGNGIIIDVEIDQSGFKAGTKGLKSAISSLGGAFKNFREKIKNVFKMPVSAEGIASPIKRLEGLFKSAKDRADNLRKKILELHKSSREQPAGSYSELNDNLEEAEEKTTALARVTDELAEAQENAGDAAKQAGDNSADGAKKGEKEMSRLQKIALKIRGALKKAANVAKDGFKAAAAHIGRAGKQLGKMAVNKAISGFKKLTSAVMGFGRKTQGATSQLKSFLGFAIGIASISALLSKTKSMITEGMSTLAQVDSRTNKSISDLKTSLTTLKNSLASAFSPILNVILPILTTFTNALSGVVDKIGMFFAVLTGQKTYHKAVAVQEDYAASLNNTAGAADNVAKSAKEAQRQLAGFDELNILQDNNSNDSGSGGSGGAGGASPGDYFQAVDLANSPISDFANKVKDLIKNQNWEELGAVLAEKVNGLIKKAQDVLNPDSKQMKKLVGYVEGFVATFNSFVDHIDWSGLGKAIGYGINDLVNLAYPIVHNIKWENLGKKFAEGANSLVNTINWEKLAETIGDYIMIMPKMVAGFVHEFDFGNLGSKLADAAVGLIKSIKLSTIADAIFSTINGIFKTGGAFSKKMEENGGWKALSKNISGGFNKAITTIQPGEWAKSASSLAKNLFTVVGNAIKEIKWAELGRKIADFVNNIDYRGLVTSILNLLGNALQGALEGLAELFTSIDWGGLVKGILDGIWTWLKKFDWKKFFKNLWKLIWGVIKGVFQVAGAILQWLWQIGKDIWKAICKGIGNLWNAIVNAFVIAWNWVADIAGKIWNGICAGIGNLWDIIVAGCTGLIDGAAWLGKQIWNGITSVLEGIGKWFNRYVINPIKYAFFKVMQGIGTGLDWAIGWTGLSWGKDLKNWAEENLAAMDREEEAWKAEEEWQAKSLDEKVEAARAAGEAMSQALGIDVKVNGKDAAIKDIEDLKNEAKGFAKDWTAKLKQWGAGDGELTKEQIAEISEDVGNFAGDYLAKLKQQGADITDEKISEVSEKAKAFAGEYLADIQQKNGKITQADIEKCAEAATLYDGDYKAYLMCEGDQLVKDKSKAASDAADKVNGKRTAELDVKDNTKGGTGNFFKDIEDNIQKVIGKKTPEVEAKDNTKGGTGNFFTEIANDIKKVADSKTTTFKGDRKHLNETADNAKKKISNVASSKTTKFKGDRKNLNSAADNAKKKIKAVAGEKTTKFKGDKSNLDKNAEKAKETVKNKVPSSKKINITSSGSYEVKSSLQSGLGSAWNKMVDEMSKSKDFLQRTMGLTIKAVKIHLLAKGGIVSGATNAIIGEDGKEAVIPLEKNTGWMKLLAAKLVLEMQGVLRKSINDALKSVGNAAKKVSGGVEIRTQKLDGSLDAFSRKMSGNLNTFSNKLQAIADKVTFRLPKVVSSGVMPYSSAAASERTIVRAIETSNDELGIVFARAVSNATVTLVNAIQRNGGAKVVIDKKALADSVVDEVNRRTRMNGTSPILM